MPASVAGSSDAVVSPSTALPSSGSSASSSRGASEPPSSAGTIPSAAVSVHGPFSRISAASGVVPPRCSLGGYCTGASVPITGDRASDAGRFWRASGYSRLAARLPPVTFLSTGPEGLAAAIGASRPSRASVSVPFV